VTPNLDEARALTEERDPERAARVLLEAGAEAVLVKGGHAEGPPDDFLLTAAGGSWIRGTRVEIGPVHGTGCALSAAIAARIALGEPLREAVEGAKGFLEAALKRTAAHGAGDRLLRLGPPAARSPG
jgi:hydroxymethylpyrimidine/phosphomethylpyrimidine kinase